MAGPYHTHATPSTYLPRHREHLPAKRPTAATGTAGSTEPPPPSFKHGGSPQEDQAGAAAQGAHTRVYQACIPCRKRKVRCNLGPVDNPHDPPCDRCRRECKECYFSATRRKSRAPDSAPAQDGEDEDIEIRGARKRLKSETAEPTGPVIHGYSAYPLTPGRPQQPTPQFQRPTLAHAVSNVSHSSYTVDRDHADEQASMQTAQILSTSEIHGGHDALHVLIEAATGQGAGNVSVSTGSRDPDLAVGRGSYAIPTSSPSMVRKMTSGSLPSVAFSPVMAPPVDPAIMAYGTAAESAAGLTSALKAWSRFKFVRAGWFTAQEAIAYVDYFYKKLSPLTPIVMPDYSALGNHSRLLEEEPMLAVTILTISSRHMKLVGAGSMSRPYAIHTKLWAYLEGMINRLVWGQEQFGGEQTSTTGAQHGSDIIPFTRKGLRTLGTVESLMLLTDWHPRSMHFPPDDDDAELMLPEGGVLYAGYDSTDSESPKGIGGQRMDTWLEPCWRSDRICWMLLSMSMSLAFEIGVFDENAARHISDQNVSDQKRKDYERRRLYVKNLLLVYMTQTSGRVGLTSMLPKNYCEPALSNIFSIHNVPSNSPKDLVIHLWLRIASIMKTGNEELFPNRNHTRDIIRTGRYKALLQGLYPSLVSWRQTMDGAKNIPEVMKHVLNIDFEYCRVYLNSLGLQAVVERTQEVRKMPGNDSAVPVSILEKCYGNDRFYIDEVVDGSHNLFKAVVDGLYPNEHLRHAPVRTYFRIISVAIVLLKTFALGASANNVATSLHYLDRTIDAFHQCIVDDVHVASRFADLLNTLVSRIKSRIVRVNKLGVNGSSRATSKSPKQGTVNPVQQSVPSFSPRRPSDNWSGHPAVQSQNGTRGDPKTHSNNNNSNNNAHHDALHGISTQTYDFDDNGVYFSIMPPPTNPPSPSLAQQGGQYGGSVYQTQNNHHRGEYVGADGNAPDWLAIPLDPMFMSYNGDVTQAGFGPGVGEYDMLELLLNTGSGSG